MLRALVRQILEHDASLGRDADTHFRDGSEVHGIVMLGRRAAQDRLPRRHDLGRQGLETRVLAQRLDLNERLVRLRLRPADLRAELEAAKDGRAGHWVTSHQLLWAAQHLNDHAMVTALRHEQSA